jgi:hypothetical protein
MSNPSRPHAFQRHHLRSFHLAGTVALPCPFPEVGKLTLLPKGFAYVGAEGETTSDLVLIEHEHSHRVTITRYVLLDDVYAVLFAPIDRPTGGDWHFGPEIGRELAARSSRKDPSKLMGIAYVREQAPVLMRVDVGMTAAESAEYYPPGPGERSDAHYAFGPVKKFGCTIFPPPRDQPP